MADGRVVAYSRANDSISSARRPVVAAVRAGVHSRARSRSSSWPTRVALEPVAVLEPVAEDDVHHAEGERGVGPG